MIASLSALSKLLPPWLRTRQGFSPVEELYTVYGLADDFKASVSTMSEFGIIEDAARLFGSIRGKCKVLALVRWRNFLQQEDIAGPLPSL